MFQDTMTDNIFVKCFFNVLDQYTVNKQWVPLLVQIILSPPQTTTTEIINYWVYVMSSNWSMQFFNQFMY